MFSVQFKTLVSRETKRFINVYNQTLIAPTVNSVLLFSIFTLVFAGHSNFNMGFEYKAFVASGLIMMAVLQNAFSNTQSTLTSAKVIGFSIDTILPPISPQTLMGGMLVGGAIRGILVGILSLAIFLCFTSFAFSYPFIAIAYVVLGSVLFALMGVAVGASTKSFDSSMSYNTYLIMPITMLSGTFYSIKMLPSVWQKFIIFNPVFYIMDGFRYGMLGITDSPFSNLTSFLIVFGWILIVAAVAYFFLKRKHYEL
jgi:ABC-2 type transport system permease protein